MCQGESLYGGRNDAGSLAVRYFLGLFLRAADQATCFAAELLFSILAYLFAGLLMRHPGQLLQALLCFCPAFIRLGAAVLRIFCPALRLFLFLCDSLILFLQQNRLFIHILFTDRQAIFNILQLFAAGLGALFKLLTRLDDFRARQNIGLFQPIPDLALRLCQPELRLFLNGVRLPTADQSTQCISAKHAGQPEQESDRGIAHIVPRKVCHKMILMRFRLLPSTSATVQASAQPVTGPFTGES